MRLAVICLLISLTSLAAEEIKPSRSWRLAEIEAKISKLQRQMDVLQESKRQILGVPDAPVRHRAKVDRTRVQTGPRNGKYHYSPKGRKVYEPK